MTLFTASRKSFSVATYPVSARQTDSNLSSRSNGVHPGFRTNTADIGAGAVGAETSKKLVTDVALDAHGPRVDLEDVRPPLQIRQAEFDLAVKPPRAQQRRIERIWPEK